MTARRLLLVPILVAGCLVAGCGTLTSPGTPGAPGDPTVAEEEPVPNLPTPPPVEISYDGGAARLRPWSFCYANACVDGIPPAQPHSVGSPAEVRVSYPLEGWRFSAELRTAGERCGRSQHVDLEPSPDGAWTLRPAGFAGTYDVNLFGRSPREGDLAVTFRWATPQDGPLPVPGGRAAVLADHDGELDSYGVEVELWGLAATPRRAEAEVSVVAEDGSSVTIEPRRRRGCHPEGSVYWTAPDSEGRAATALPGETFRYRVVVRLDGAGYVGTATWPADLIEGNEPSTTLEFTPPLPALQPR